MKLHDIPLLLSCAGLVASAARVSFKGVHHQNINRQTLERRGPGRNDPQGLNLTTVHDLIYIVDMEIGGKEYPVQLDTGSSDLWIKGPTYPLPGAQETSTAANLSYAIGWVNGTIAYAPVTFANLSVQSQAFLDVSNAKNPALEYGVNGVVGLGFSSLSTIDRLVNVSGKSTGRSLLYNVFSIHPDEPNFLAFSLQRSTAKDSEVEGSFSVGEYDPDFVDAAQSKAIPTWPVTSPERWNLLVDAVIVGDNVIIPSTVVSGAPSNKAVALMDSGSSYSYVSKEIADAIYSRVPGAVFDTNLVQWVIPCGTEIDMAIQLGGHVYPVHPLDVTPNGLANTSSCVGSFVPEPVSVAKGDFDWILGANFLRSVYSVYDFGDFDSSGKMGNPYFKFLSVTDPNKASADFHAVRGGTPRNNISYKGLEGASLAPSGSLSKDAESALERIVDFLPAILGVVALNALVLIVLVSAGAIYYCRRRRQRGATVPFRTPRGRMSPMPMNARHTYYAGNFEPPQAAHTYEPVSMALTEDTFVPPSPAFHKGDSDGGRDRPKSVA